jgi:hypothetical protein
LPTRGTDESLFVAADTAAQITLSFDDNRHATRMF